MEVNKRVKKNNTCVISCIFGGEFSVVYPAPLEFESFFFTNSKYIKKEVEKKGWKYLYVDFEVYDCLAKSSFQSKFIKFLQFRFMSEYKELLNFQKLVYVDHKFKLTDKHVSQLERKVEKSVLIRKTPKLKTTIWDEVKAANLQERYVDFMPQTLEYISVKLGQSYSENIRICNTGLIVYDLTDNVVSEIVDEVYSDLESVGTSECQIIWAFVSQKFSNYIQVIEWEEIPIIWKQPEV